MLNYLRIVFNDVGISGYSVLDAFVISAPFAFAFLVMASKVFAYLYPDVLPPPSQPTMLNYHWPEVSLGTTDIGGVFIAMAITCVFILAFVIRHYSSLKRVMDKAALAKEIDDEEWEWTLYIGKLTKDKETLAKEVATLKNRIEEGDEEIRKLTMDKETSAKEVHWMEMWKDANAQLKQLRAELKCLVDDVVRAELLVDIEGLKKRKGDMAKLLGMTK